MNFRQMLKRNEFYIFLLVILFSIAVTLKNPVFASPANLLSLLKTSSGSAVFAVGIDIGSKHNIHAIIRELAGQGMGIIVISDEIPELLGNCNRILVMGEGRITGRIARAAEATEDQVRAIIDRRGAAVEGA